MRISFCMHRIGPVLIIRQPWSSFKAVPSILSRGVAWPTLMAFLRVATHPLIFSHPLTPQEALGNVQALLRLLPLSEAIHFLKSIEKSRETFPYEETWFPMRIWRLFFGNIIHPQVPLYTRG